MPIPTYSTSSSNNVPRAATSPALISTTTQLRTVVNLSTPTTPRRSLQVSQLPLRFSWTNMFFNTRIFNNFLCRLWIADLDQVGPFPPAFLNGPKLWPLLWQRVLNCNRLYNCKGWHLLCLGQQKLVVLDGFCTLLDGSLLFRCPATKYIAAKHQLPWIEAQRSFGVFTWTSIGKSSCRAWSGIGSIPSLSSRQWRW